MTNMTQPADTLASPDAITNLQEQARLLRDLAIDPVMALMLAPDSVRVTFPYGGSDLVLLARSPEALARLGRNMRVTRSHRHGRSGNRRWESTLRDPAQMPKPAVPTKAR